MLYMSNKIFFIKIIIIIIIAVIVIMIIIKMVARITNVRSETS